MVYDCFREHVSKGEEFARVSHDDVKKKNSNSRGGWTTYSCEDNYNAKGRLRKDNRDKVQRTMARIEGVEKKNTL